MKPEAGIWNKLTRIVIVLIILAGLIALGRPFLPVIRQNEQMRRRISSLEAELEAEREQARQLQQEIDLLTKDRAALEREIRYRLRLARPGETVIWFDPSATNATIPQEP